MQHSYDESEGSKPVRHYGKKDSICDCDLLGCCRNLGIQTAVGKNYSIDKRLCGSMFLWDPKINEGYCDSLS